MVDGVPWAVGGGAEIQVEALRLLSYVAIGGQEGVLGGTDFKVKSSDPDGPGVVVSKGAAGTLNYGAGADGGQQAYLARQAADSDPIAIAPTGSGGGRTDLVALVIEDPQYAGQPAPASVKNGPYAKLVVYQGVAANVWKLSHVDPGQTGIALARIAIPAVTATITDAMITDLRVPMSARTSPFAQVINTPTGRAMPQGVYGDWLFGPTVRIPPWANRVAMSATVSAATAAPDVSSGGLSLVLGSMATPTVAFSLPGAGVYSASALQVGATLVVPPAMRGTDQQFVVVGNQQTGSVPVSTDGYTSVRFDAFFSEALT